MIKQCQICGKIVLNAFKHTKYCKECGLEVADQKQKEYRKRRKGDLN